MQVNAKTIVFSLVAIVCVAIIIANYAPSFQQPPKATLPPTQTINPLNPPDFQVILSPISQTVGQYQNPELSVRLGGSPDYPCTVTLYGGSGNPLSYSTYKSSLNIMPNIEQKGQTVTYTVTVKDSTGTTCTSNQVQIIYK
jgi:hypothetical protein